MFKAFSRGLRGNNPLARQIATLAFATLLAIGATAGISAPSAFADDPAVVIVTAPTDGATYGDSTSPPVLAIANSGDIATQECKYDNTAYRDCGNLEYPGLRLTNGAHRYVVRTVDTLGNATLATVNFTIADLTAPTDAIAVAPDDNAVVESPVTDKLGFDISTDDINARVYASIDGGGAERLDAYGPSYRWNPSHIANGPHTAHVIAIDGAGNTSTASVSFTLDDQIAPTLQIDAPTANQVLATGELHAMFGSSDIRGSFTCQIDSGPLQFCQPNDTFVVTDLPVGAHTLTVDAVDAVGNSNSAVANFSVTNSAVPGLAIAEPMSGATYAAQPTLKLNLSATLAPFTLRCSINGGKFEYCAEGDPLSGVDHNGSWTVTAEAVTDTGLQVADTSTFTVNDTAAVQVSATEPAAAITDVSAFLPNFSVADTFADNTASTQISARCQIDLQPSFDCNLLYSADLAPTYTPGVHTFKVTALDWIGNAASLSFPFTIADSIAPAVQILSPLNNATIAGDSFTLDFAATGGAVRLRCQIGNGAQVPCDSGDHDGVQSWSPSSLPQGSSTLTVYATDAAGNTGSASINVNLQDTTGPAISFIDPAAAATVSDMVVAQIIGGEQLFGLRCGVGATQAVLAVDATACVINPNDRLTAWFRPPALTSGLNTLWIEASDNHGNATVISRQVTVSDATAPDLTIAGLNVDGTETTFDSPSSLSYRSSDASAHFNCALDAASFSACGTGGSGTLTLTPVTNGSHVIHVRAVDPSGNTTSRDVNYTVTDTTPPGLSVDDAYNGMTVGDSLVTHPQATGAVTLECAIDSGAFAACSSSGWTADFAAFGAHNLHYRAIDAAGNSVVRTVSVVKPAPAQPTPPAVTDPPVTPPSVPTLPSATPAFAAIKAKPAKSTVTLPVMVTLALPSGTNAAAACNGSATLAVTVGKKVVKTVSVPLKLVKGKCQVTSALKIKSALIAGKKFSVSISFAGNAAIAKFYAAKQGKAGAAKK